MYANAQKKSNEGGENIQVKYEHLTLPLINDEFERKKRKITKMNPYPSSGRDKSDFYSTQIENFNKIKENYNKNVGEFRKYYDPNLIFKINVAQGVPIENFINELNRMDIEVICEAPNKKGFWVVFSEDVELRAFREKIEKYSKSTSYAFFNAIEGMHDIPSEEKIGPVLSKKPFEENEDSYLDVEIWRMNDEKIDEFRIGFIKIVDEFGGKICDEFLTENFYLIRIKGNYGLYKKIRNLKEISYLDRPPKIKLEDQLELDIQKLEKSQRPKENATGILVVDSGILSSHPLLEGAIGEAIAVPTKYSKKISEDDPYDDVGHGTQVAGIALYGDIRECIKQKKFNQDVRIYSAKVMYRDDDGYSTYDEEELIEHQLDRAVRSMASSYPDCRVINLSFGNSVNIMIKDKRQFNLAALIDSLSKELHLIFVISIGNRDCSAEDTYPQCLLEDSDRTRIIDPATSALALTIGAICEINKIEKPSRPSQVYYPSPITRVGPGYKGMIKPDLVENGGGGFEEENDIITLNPRWIPEGRAFTSVCGTSFSAPKIANFAARIINKYPRQHSNLIKALLISSAKIPVERPSPLSEYDIMGRDKDAAKLYNIYGHGQPDLEKALFSEDNRVILMKENTIKLNQIHLYYVNIPSNFLEEHGLKKIITTLVFDPPINKNVSEYLGAAMEVRLFKNITASEVASAYSTIKIGEKDVELVPRDIAKKELKMKPGINLRKKGVHQKGIIEYKEKKKNLDIDIEKPLVLAVICQDHWIKDNDYLQDYAVVLTIEHSGAIDLYNQIHLRNRERIELSIKG